MRRGCSGRVRCMKVPRAALPGTMRTTVYPNLLTLNPLPLKLGNSDAKLRPPGHFLLVSSAFHEGLHLLVIPGKVAMTMC